MSNRNIRVSELIKREVSDILHTRFQREAVAITVTRVDVAPDHSNAKVFYTTLLGNEEERLRAQRLLDRFAGKIRFELGKRIVLKRLPALNFHYDVSIAQGDRVNEIIDSFEIDENGDED